MIRSLLHNCIVAVLLLCTGCITSFDGQVIPAMTDTLKSEFKPSSYEASNGVTLMTRTYYPEIAMRKFPLIVYLHGAGQNGNDNEQQLDDSVGCLYSFTHDRDDYKSVILVPQCPAGVYWRDEKPLEALMELIASVAQHQLIDEDRVYITGFSMGGDASWKIALANPELPTTIIPVCGGPLASMEPDIPDVPDAMTDLNIWAFNNFDDGVVRPTYSKRIMSKIWESDPKETHNFTEFVSGGHSPKQVYRNRDILIWMLSTRRTK